MKLAERIARLRLMLAQQRNVEVVIAPWARPKAAAKIEGTEEQSGDEAK
jgi:hypothetical protein